MSRRPSRASWRPQKWRSRISQSEYAMRKSATVAVQCWLSPPLRLQEAAATSGVAPWLASVLLEGAENCFPCSANTWSLLPMFTSVPLPQCECLLPPRPHCRRCGTSFEVRPGLSFPRPSLFLHVPRVSASCARHAAEGDLLNGTGARLKCCWPAAQPGPRSPVTATACDMHGSNASAASKP